MSDDVAFHKKKFADDRNSSPHISNWRFLVSRAPDSSLDRTHDEKAASIGPQKLLHRINRPQKRHQIEIQIDSDIAPQKKLNASEEKKT